jgi:hypothetical protein
MRAKLPLRISSIILFLFALGHTVGFQTFRPASRQGLEVMEAMRSVPLVFGSATVHWMDLYMGFGLAVSVSGFFSAIVAWRLRLGYHRRNTVGADDHLAALRDANCKHCSQYPVLRPCPGWILAGIFRGPGLECDTAKRCE